MSNIKVCLRIKPQLSDDIQPQLPVLIKKNESSNKLYFKHRNDTKIFTFDEIYTPEIKNEEVYNSLKEDLIGSALQGFNYCLMAYGQTSSGKTHTLLGEGNENPGVLARFIEDLFSNSNNIGVRDLDVKCSFFEIYNEIVYDLLDEDKKNLLLREDPKKGVFVEGLSEQKVTSLSETLGFFEQGMSKRVTAETRLNERSSRSHGIFTIRIEFVMPDENLDTTRRKKFKLKKRSVIHFVDLAGSERQQGDGDAERLKESCTINKSLVVLSNVITSLTKDGNKGRFLHFRDSKLTFYLRDVFGGNSRTAIITNVINEAQFYYDTFNTLRFSATAKSIKTFPKANFVAEGSEEELQAEINYLMRKLSKMDKSNKGIKNKDVLKLVLRLENAWKDAENEIKSNGLMIKDSLAYIQQSINEFCQETREMSKLPGSNKFQASGLPTIIERIEDFFEKTNIPRVGVILPELKKGENLFKQALKLLRAQITGDALHCLRQSPVFFNPGNKENNKAPDHPTPSLSSNSIDYIEKLISRNEEFEEKIVELSREATNNMKEFSAKLEEIENENLQLREILMTKADALAKAEEELFEYKNGRPLNEDEIELRTSQLDDFIHRVKMGGKLWEATDYSFRRSAEFPNNPLKGSSTTPNFSKKNEFSVITREELSNLELQKSIARKLYEDSPDYKQRNNSIAREELFKENDNEYLYPEIEAEGDYLHSKLSYFESVCRSKDDIIETLRSQLRMERAEKANALFNLKTEITEEEISTERVDHFKGRFESAKDEINVLRSELIKAEAPITKPNKSRSGYLSAGSLKEIIEKTRPGAVSYDFGDYFYGSKLKRVKNSGKKSSSSAKRKHSTGNVSTEHKKKKLNASAGKLSKTQRGELSYASEYGPNVQAQASRQSFRSHRNFKKKLEMKGPPSASDVVETNLIEKNREIIFYLKEIDKLQNENENLRDTRVNNEHLKAYKLKLQNKKLKDTLKKLVGKKQEQEQQE